MEDGRLVLAYVYRSDYGSRVHLRFSDDYGQSWGNEITLRSGDGATKDAGYPPSLSWTDLNTYSSVKLT